jgi:hypothetical protein
MRALHRTTLPALIVAGLGLLWPAASGAAQPTVSASADAGQVAVAQAVLRTRGGRAAPRLALARPGAVPSGALVVGGVRRVRRGRYLASLAVIRAASRTPDARAAAAVAVRARVRTPRGMRFVGFAGRSAASNVANRAASRSLCRALPSSFSHGTRLTGPLLPGYDARTTLRNAFWLGCRNWGGRADFVAALARRGVTAAPTAPGGDTSAEPDEAGSGDGTVPPQCREDPSLCDPDDGPPTTSTVSGSGSVTRDAADPNVYRYSIQFGEPVRGYKVAAGRASVECPSRSGYPAYPRCEGLGDSQRPSAGGADLSCGPAEFTYEFLCALAQSRGGAASTIPAGTTITGSFSVDAGSVGPGEVRVYGENAQGAQATTPFNLSGPA